MMPLIDTHCHLADPRLSGDLDAVIERARDSGVISLIAIGAIGSVETDGLTVEIAERHRDIFAVVGVHPHDAKDCDTARLDQLRKLAESSRVVAIGETGLDFHYMHSAPQAQERALRAQLELARQCGLPVVIHCRKAESRIVEIVREVGMPPKGGVIHCFSADLKAAEEFLELGFYLSFSGILTFKKADELRAAARVVPAKRVLVETDAPYLAPEPVRSRRNEPAYVRYTLEKLAEIRGDAVEDLAAAIVRNASALFGVALDAPAAAPESPRRP
jgi:TatD DNase family protein